MRILGIDYGDARIGTSVCDELQTMAHPLKTYKSESMRKNIDTMSALAKSENAGLIVVGLPLNMDGSEGARASRCRKFAAFVKALSGLPTAVFDERMTTMTAARYLNETNTRGKKRKTVIDTLSAQIILQNCLDRLKYMG